MFKLSSSKVSLADGSAPSFSYLSSDLLVLGDIRASGIVHIHGTIEGNVAAEQVKIPVEARVVGDVTASDVTVCGQVTGTITGMTVLIEFSAEISGILNYEDLTVHPGAHVEGQMIPTRNSRLLEVPTSAAG